VKASTVRATGAIGSKASPAVPGRANAEPGPVTPAAAGAVVGADVRKAPTAIATAPAAPRPSRARRDRAAEATSRKCALDDVLHSGPRHALAHLYWHVTAERLPRTWSAIGSDVRGFGSDVRGFSTMLTLDALPDVRMAVSILAAANARTNHG
jgi:hypothetical protein